MTGQPAPIKNDNPALWPLVIEDFKKRNELGYKKYGTYLKPYNGRNSLIDLTEELFDAIVYLRQLREEMKCLKKVLYQVQSVLAESQYLQKEECASLAEVLMQNLKKNCVLNAD